MSTLPYRERPAAEEPAGLLVLHHGRGADEHDLLGLADVLDPGHHIDTAPVPAAIEWLSAVTGSVPAAAQRL